MKFKIGDKVICDDGKYKFKGKITGRFLGGNTYCVTNENQTMIFFDNEMEKEKHITLKQAFKDAEKEKAEQERTIEITNKFIRVLGR